MNLHNFEWICLSTFHSKRQNILFSETILVFPEYQLKVNLHNFELMSDLLSTFHQENVNSKAIDTKRVDQTTLFDII